MAGKEAHIDEEDESLSHIRRRSVTISVQLCLSLSQFILYLLFQSWQRSL